MHLPEPVASALTSLFESITGSTPDTVRVRHASGGCINQGAVVTASGHTLFVKWNSAGRFPGMFAAEARGLELMARVGEARVPAVVGQGEWANVSWLALDYIEPASATESSMEHLGCMLATMHRATQPSFGLDHNNYMGSLPQSNRTHDTWPEFYVQERLTPQIRIARDQGALSTADLSAFDHLCRQIPELVPVEPPALVHGDLWSGNYLTDPGRTPWLIDPAVAFNHRETDIAMSLLFGGFSQRFYEVYQSRFPLKAGWQDRTGLFQLYPLLIHVNLFGGGYLRSVREILKRY